MPRSKPFRPIAVFALSLGLLSPALAQGVVQPPPAQTSAEAPPAAAPAAAAKAVVSELVFDAGTVVRGEVIRHEFVVENAGTAPLTIESVKPSCGCTVPEFDRTVAPGSKGRVTLSVATMAFKGPISKKTAVNTDDPNLKTFELIVKAEVKEIIAVKPDCNQQFGIVSQGHDLVGKYELNSTDGLPFKVTRIESSDSSLKHELVLAPDSKSAVFKVTIPKDHELGGISARFVLSTDHPKVPTIILNTYATVREALAVDPSEVNFGEISGADLRRRPEDLSFTRMVTVFNDDGGLQVKSAKSSNPALTTTIVPAEPGKRYFIRVGLLPALKAGPFEGNITIVTPKKTFQVPVKGRVK